MLHVRIPSSRRIPAIAQSGVVIPAIRSIPRVEQPTSGISASREDRSKVRRDVRSRPDESIPKHRELLFEVKRQDCQLPLGMRYTTTMRNATLFEIHCRTCERKVIKVLLIASYEISDMLLQSIVNSRNQIASYVDACLQSLRYRGEWNNNSEDKSPSINCWTCCGITGSFKRLRNSCRAAAHSSADPSMFSSCGFSPLVNADRIWCRNWRRPPRRNRPSSRASVRQTKVYDHIEADNHQLGIFFDLPRSGTYVVSGS